jgi:hypothetical protein
VVDGCWACGWIFVEGGSWVYASLGLRGCGLGGCLLLVVFTSPTSVTLWTFPLLLGLLIRRRMSDGLFQGLSVVSGLSFLLSLVSVFPHVSTCPVPLSAFSFSTSPLSSFSFPFSRLPVSVLSVSCFFWFLRYWGDSHGKHGVMFTDKPWAGHSCRGSGSPLQNEYLQDSLSRALRQLNTRFNATDLSVVIHLV